MQADTATGQRTPDIESFGDSAIGSTAFNPCSVQRGYTAFLADYAVRYAASTRLVPALPQAACNDGGHAFPRQACVLFSIDRRCHRRGRIVTDPAHAPNAAHRGRTTPG